MKGVSTEQPCQVWGFQKSGGLGWFWHSMGPIVSRRVKTLGMVPEKLLFAFAYNVTTTTRSIFRWWDEHFQKQAGERKSQAPGTRLPSSSPNARDFSKLSRRAEQLSPGEQDTLCTSMTSKWLSVLYTFIYPATDLEAIYLLFHVKTMECRSAAKSWFPFPDINHFALTLYQKKK